MLIHFIKVKTTKDNIKISFDNGDTWTTHEVTENGTHADDIEFTKSDCNDISDIIIGSAARHKPNASDSMKKYFSLETVNTKYTTPEDFLSLLQSLPENTVETAYSIKIKGITADNFNKVKDAITTSKKNIYMDLSSSDLRFCSEIFTDYFLGEDNQKYLTGITLPDDIFEIGSNTFNGCINLKSIEIPPSITDIGRNSFYNCLSLKTIDLPAGLKTIGSHAFDHDTSKTSSLEKIRFPGPIQKWSRIEKGDNNFFEEASHLETKGAESVITPIWEAFLDNNLDFVTQSLSENGGSLQNPIIDRDVATMNKDTLDEIFESIDVYVDASSTPINSINCLDSNDSSSFFRNKSKKHITSLTIPESFSSIGMFWFSNYENLHTVFIEGSNLKEIKQGAFTNCYDLTDITLPSSLTKIGYRAFHNCSKLRLSCEYNSSFSTFFDGTGITRDNVYELKLPNTLTSINPNEFENCTSLTSIKLPDTITEIGENAFKGCKKLKSLVIPNGITEIKSGTFKDCTELKTVTIPTTITTISDYAFENCSNLELIIWKDWGNKNEIENTFGPELESIGIGAFKDCKSLKRINLEDTSITTLSPEAFYNCKSLVELKLPKNLEVIDDHALRSCINLKNIVLPNTLKLINDYSFFDTGITSIDFPEQLQVLGIGAFKKSKLTTVTLPDGFTNIGDSCFMESDQLTTLNLPNTLRYIDANAFNGCALGDVVLPEGLKEIGYQAFANSTISNVTIPSSVTGTKQVVSFAEDAFDNLDKITVIRMPTNITVTANGVGGLYNDDTLKDVVYIPENTTEIPEEGFSNCTNIKDLCLPPSIKTIGENAFVGCTQLQSIYLPSTVETIEAFAFNSCFDLKDVYYQGTEEQWKELIIGWYSVDVVASDGTVLKDKNNNDLKDMGKKLYIKKGNDNLFKEDVKVHFNCLPFDVSMGSNDTTYNFTRKKNYGNVQFSVDDEKDALRIDSITGINATLKLTTIIYAFGKHAFSDCPNLHATFTYTDDLDEYFHDSGISKSNRFNVSIPKKIKNISEGIFKNYTGLEEVVFEKGSTLDSIGDYAFYNCTSLNKFTNLPESINDIGKYAFMNCKGLKSIILNESTEVIKEGTFEGCTGLTTITYPTTLKAIETRAFYNCTSLGKIRFYDDLQSIGADAFYNCPSVRLTCNHNSYYSDGQPGWQSRSMYLGISGLTTRNVEILYISDTCTEIEADEFINEEESLQGLSYQYDNLKEIYLPKSVTKIGERAFAGCRNLKTVSIPDDSNLITICDDAFLECSSLEAFNFTSKLTTIGDNAFSMCPFKTVSLPESVKNFGTGIFSGCDSLVSIHLPSTMTKIPMDMFLGNTKLTTINIPNGVVEFDEECFMGCTSLTNFEIRNNVPTVQANAFNFCTNIKLTCYYNKYWDDIYAAKGFTSSQVYYMNVDVPMTSIPDYKFENFVNLININFNKNGTSKVTSIGVGAFRGCKSLDTIVPPESCNIIQDWAFADSGLKDVTIPKDVKRIAPNVCLNCNKLTTIQFKGSPTETYENAFKGCSSLVTVNLPNSITRIGKSLFQDCTALTTINIPTASTMVEDNCFTGCESLKNVTIHNDVTEIGSGVFADCKNLSSITLPSSLEEIGNSCFENCVSLKTISVPDSVTTLGSRSFFNCSSLTTANLPSTLKEIRFGTFENCNSLTSFTLPKNVEIIEGNVFTGCVNLTISKGSNTKFSVTNNGKMISSSDGKTILAYIDYHTTTFTIPSGVSKIGNGAFKNCSKLINVEFSNGVEYIDEYSFKDCGSLQKIELPTTLIRIGKGAFENCTRIGIVEGTGIYYAGNESKWNNVKVHPDGNSIITYPLRNINFAA